MKPYSLISVIAAAVLFLSTQALPQGSREARPVAEAIAGAAVGETGVLTYDRPTGDAELDRLWRGEAQSAGKSLQTGVDIPADIYGYLTGPENTRHVLVSGRNTAGNGIVEHYKYNSTNGLYELQSSFILAADFTGVAYSKPTARIFLLDGVNQKIWWNTWNGTDPLPGAWNVYVTATEVPELSDPGASTYQLELSASFGNKLLLVRVGDMLEPSYQTVMLEGDAGSVTVTRDAAPDYTRPYLEQLLSFTEGGTTITVKGEELATFSLIDAETQAILGAGQIPTGQEEVTITSSTPFVIGKKYIILRSDHELNQEYAFECVRRYGFSEALSNGILLEGLYHPGGLKIGNPHFLSRTAGFKNPPPAAPIYLGAVLGIGFRNMVTGADPVVPAGANQLLMTDVFVPASGSVHVSGNGLLSSDFLAIPNDPSLVGAVVLTQFYVIDGEATRLSEIIGMVMRQGDPAGGQGLSAGGPAARLQAQNRWIVEALKRGAIRDPGLAPRVLSQRTK